MMIDMGRGDESRQVSERTIQVITDRKPSRDFDRNHGEGASEDVERRSSEVQYAMQRRNACDTERTMIHG